MGSNAVARIGCGLLLIIAGVVGLLWTFGIFELKYLWIPVAIVLIIGGFRLVFRGGGKRRPR